MNSKNSPQNKQSQKRDTIELVEELKEQNQDFEFYPTSDEMIQAMTADIRWIGANWRFSRKYDENIRLLDIGAGDGRVLQQFEKALKIGRDESRLNISKFAIEKAQIHIDSYIKKGITLLGTEFNETNFISKNCEIGIVNPPYSNFSKWLETLILQLNFRVLYAVIPERWESDERIKAAIEARGVTRYDVIFEGDFLMADRKARAKVNIIRFCFDNLETEHSEKVRRFCHGNKPLLGENENNGFQVFIDRELGLKKTYSTTTQAFSAYSEERRIKADLINDETETYKTANEKGILWALLADYENVQAKTLEQYKLISQIDAELLQTLGISFDSLVSAVEAKLFGYNNVYWNLLFEHLNVLKSKLINKHKQELLNTLKQNALDFTYRNAVYVISYAVDLSNELVDKSLTHVFQKLTSEKSIKRYYKSNERVFTDTWRHNRQCPHDIKRELDYRFIYDSGWNFGKEGLSTDAISFIDDLIVILNLLGYSKMYPTKPFTKVEAGEPLSVMGFDPDGNLIELIQIRFYLKDTRHIKFNQNAMLRFNVTVSRILGWVRNKQEFEAETNHNHNVPKDVWDISDKLKVTAKTIMALADKSNQAA